MLTLREPIKIKASSPIRRRPSLAPEAMKLNYGLISAEVEPEDLLHLVTTPAEIFLQEGGVTNFISESASRMHQENKIEVINNVLNRILLNENGHYTYQDRVYISSILRKIGIRNEEKFMQTVLELKQHTDNTNRLINIYEQNSGVLRELVHNVNTIKEKEAKASGTAVNVNVSKDRYYLQDSVYRRLDTKSIYDIVNAWQSYTINDMSHVKNETVRLGDQTKLSQVMQLHELKNSTVNNEQSLYYLHSNPYETGEDMDVTNITEKKVTEELVSAVMLNLIDNIYSSVSSSLEKNETSFIDTTNAFFHAADNTFRRFETFHNETWTEQQSTVQYVEEVNKNEKEEIDILNEFIENTVPLYYSTAENTENETEILNRTENFLNTSRTVNDIKNIANDVRQYNEGDRNENTQEFSRKELHFNTIEEQVAYYDEQNRIMHEQVLKLQQETPRKVSVQIDRERARKDALRALEHPEELISEYSKEHTENRTETHTETQYEKLVSKETKEILQRYEEIRSGKGSEKLPDTEQAEGMLMKDIIESERVVLEHPKPEEPEDRVIHDRKVINETVNNITEKLIDNVKAAPLQEAYEKGAAVSMTHKSVAPEIDEETVEELIRQNQVKYTNEQKTENISEKQTTEKIVNNINREVHNEYREDISELISRGVRKEMASISNEVMKKLEQRMQIERSRRGY